MKKYFMMIVSELEKEIYSLKGINTLNLSVNRDY